MGSVNQTHIDRLVRQAFSPKGTISQALWEIFEKAVACLELYPYMLQDHVSILEPDIRKSKRQWVSRIIFVP